MLLFFEYSSYLNYFSIYSGSAGSSYTYSADLYLWAPSALVSFLSLNLLIVKGCSRSIAESASLSSLLSPKCSTYSVYLTSLPIWPAFACFVIPGTEVKVGVPPTVGFLPFLHLLHFVLKHCTVHFQFFTFGSQPVYLHSAWSFPLVVWNSCYFFESLMTTVQRIW